MTRSRILHKIDFKIIGRLLLASVLLPILKVHVIWALHLSLRMTHLSWELLIGSDSEGEEANEAWMNSVWASEHVWIEPDENNFHCFRSSIAVVGDAL